MGDDSTIIWLFVAGTTLAVIGGLCTWLWKVVQNDIKRAHQKADQAQAENNELRNALERQKNEIAESVNCKLAAGLREVNTQLTQLRESFHSDIGSLREDLANFSGRFDQQMNQQNGRR